MATKVNKINHTTAGIKIIKQSTLQCTSEGHFKYYYLYLFEKDTKVYLEKKWGRIGSAKGSSNVKAGISKSINLATIEFNRLKKSKIDKNYKEVDITKGSKQIDPVQEKVTSLSRFRDIA